MAIKIPTYERRVQLDSGAQTVPRIQDTSGPGRALERAGAALTAVGEHWRKRQEQFENFQMSQREARVQAEIRQIIADEMANFDPGRDPPGTLHDNIVTRTKPLIEGLAESAPSRLRPYYDERAQTLSETTSVGAAATESKIGVSYYTKELDRLTGELAQGVVNNPDSFKDAIQQMQRSVDGAVNIPTAQRRIMTNAYTKMLAESAVKGYTATGRFDDAKNFVDTLKLEQEKDLPPGPQSSTTGASPKNAQIAMNFFMGKGLSKEDAAAFVWNLQQESGKNLNPELSHDGGTGYGIAGYRDPSPGQGRRTNLFAFAGTNRPTLEQQLEFTWQELQTSERKTFDRVLAARTPEQKAAAAIGYFRPRAEYAANRASRAHEVRGLINSTPEVAPAATETAEAKPRVVVDPATGKMTMAEPSAKPVQVADASGRIIGGMQVSSAQTFDATPTELSAPENIKVADARRPLTQWGVWADTMNANIESARTKNNILDKSMNAKLKSLVQNDIASIQATGKPVTLDENSAKYFGTAILNHELISQRLGEGVAIDWEDGRQTAMRVHSATANMTQMPVEAIQSTLDGLAPQGGEPDFMRRQKVYDTALKAAQGIIADRMADPAAAADQMPDVKAALQKAQVNPADTAAARELVTARMKAQVYLGIPDTARSPITNQEAERIAAPLLDRANPNPALTTQAIIRGVRAVTGGDADLAHRALSKVLQIKGVSKEQAQDAASALEIAGRPVAQPQAVDPAKKDPTRGVFDLFADPPRPVAKGSAIDFLSTFGSAGPGARSRQPSKAAPDTSMFEPGKTFLPAEHIKMLKADPLLGSAFDETYGLGASDWVFNQKPDGTTISEAFPPPDTFSDPFGGANFAPDDL